MKYVIRYEYHYRWTSNRPYAYIKSTQETVEHLADAKVFDTKNNAEQYIVANNVFSMFTIIGITDKDIFKARLLGR